jgi:hypothetical protein
LISTIELNDYYISGVPLNNFISVIDDKEAGGFISIKLL